MSTWAFLAGWFALACLLLVSLVFAVAAIVAMKGPVSIANGLLPAEIMDVAVIDSGAGLPNKLYLKSSDTVWMAASDAPYNWVVAHPTDGISIYDDRTGYMAPVLIVNKS